MSNAVFMRDEKVSASSLLLSVGIMPSKAGFEYLREAILNYRDCAGSMQRLVAMIAERNGVTAKSVERDIRTAVGDAARKGTIGRITELLGLGTAYLQTKFRAKEFVAMAAEYLDMLPIDDYRPTTPHTRT